MKPPDKWCAVGRSVCGACHIHNGLPNQDAIQFEVGAAGDKATLMVVSDGHGSPRCFRSAKGAELAVQVAMNIARGFFLESAGSEPESIKDEVRNTLPSAIVKMWCEEVGSDLEKCPFTAEELNSLESGCGVAAREFVESRQGQLEAYGATLLLVAISGSVVYYLQLGDGDILIVSEETQQVSRPIPEDAFFTANVTTSLCQEQAEKLFRFQCSQGIPPILITVSTDGYSNSFETPDGFHKVATDLLGLIRDRGVDYVESRLPEWLAGTSNEGSGDDISLGILFREQLTILKPSPSNGTDKDHQVLPVEDQSTQVQLNPLETQNT